MNAVRHRRRRSVNCGRTVLGDRARGSRSGGMPHGFLGRPLDSRHSWITGRTSVANASCSKASAAPGHSFSVRRKFSTSTSAPWRKVPARRSRLDHRLDFPLEIVALVDRVRDIGPLAVSTRNSESRGRSGRPDRDDGNRWSSHHRRNDDR